MALGDLGDQLCPRGIEGHAQTGTFRGPQLAVAECRPFRQVRGLADGRPYTGQQALELGLIDALGGLSEAIEEAARLGGIEGEPEIIEYRQPVSWWQVWAGIRQPAQWESQSLLAWLNAQVPVPQMRYTGP